MPADPADRSDDMVPTAVQAAARVRVHRVIAREWMSRRLTVRGVAVRLRAVAVGCRLRTSERAIAEFERDCTAAKLGKQAVQPTPTQWQRAADAAKARVAALLN